MQENEKDKITQNLKDCNCDDETIIRFLTKLDAGQHEDALRILSTHRQNLLNRFHECNKHIEYLDYLVYQIENKHA